MTAGASGKRRSTANDAGAGVASAALPSVPANEIEEKVFSQAIRLHEFKSASDEMVHDNLGSEPIEGEGEELVNSRCPASRGRARSQRTFARKGQ